MGRLGAIRVRGCKTPVQFWFGNHNFGVLHSLLARVLIELVYLILVCEVIDRKKLNILQSTRYILTPGTSERRVTSLLSVYKINILIKMCSPSPIHLHCLLTTSAAIGYEYCNDTNYKSKKLEMILKYFETADLHSFLFIIFFRTMCLKKETLL